MRLNKEKIASASKQVRPGDVLTVALQRRVLVLRIVALGARRGPYQEARLLYEDLSPPPAKDEAAVSSVGYDPGTGRLTKRDRRRLEALRNPDWN